MNFHTGARMSDDADISWSRKVAIPDDLKIFEVVNPEDPTDIRLVTMDGEFGDYLGSFHPDWKKDSIFVGQIGDIMIHVINPLDLAVSKLGRFQDRDRQDIEILAQHRLFTSDQLHARGAEAIEEYVGDTTFIQYNLREAVEMVRRIEREYDCQPPS